MIILPVSHPNVISVSVARKIIYGTGAIRKLPETCSELGLHKIFVVSGGTETRNIRDHSIIPLLENVPDLEISKLEIGRKSYEEEIEILQDVFQQNKSTKTTSNKDLDPFAGEAIIAAGGGRVMHIVKVTSHFSSIPWI